MKIQISKKLVKSVIFVLVVGSSLPAFASDTFKNFANGNELKAKSAELGILDQEYMNSTGLDKINASAAYALGYSGDGINLGIFDGGVNDTLYELNDKVAHLNYAWDLEQNKYATHGTEVASVMMASKDNDNGLQGIAYNANIFDIHKSYDNITRIGTFSSDFNENNVKVINISQNFTASSALYDMTKQFLITYIGGDEKDNDRVYVLATGNNGTANYNRDNLVLAMASSESCRMNTIVVGSIDPATGIISPFSNLGSMVGKNTVYAPGENINIVSYDETGNIKYSVGDGTSYATPYVAGTMGLVQEAFPYLSGKQLVDVILSTSEIPENYPKHMLQYSNGDKRNLHIISVGEAITQEERESLLIDYRDYWYARNVWLEPSIVTNNMDPENCPEYVLSAEEVYGRGIVNAGRAVQGVAALETDRLTDSDITNRYSNINTYMYSVNTGAVEDNFKERNFSIWSNDIKEIGLNNLHVGLVKESGDVNLVLLGENTYQGATVSKGGKLQIVKGVAGDVFADGSGAEVELNGKSKNVVAAGGGLVKVSDRLDISSFNNGTVDVEANPHLQAANLIGTESVVGVEGCVMALDESSVDIDLNKSESFVRGALIEEGGGSVNLSLSNGATWQNYPSYSYFDGRVYDSIIFTEADNSWHSKYTGLSNVSLSNGGKLDVAHDGTYDAWTINKLNGSGGIITIGTDLQNQKGDYINILSTDSGGNHGIQVIDANWSNYSILTDPLKIFTAPHSLSFYSVEMEDTLYRYKANLEKLGLDWYLTGFMGRDVPNTSGSAPGEVTPPTTTNPTFSTDDILVVDNPSPWAIGGEEPIIINLVKGNSSTFTVRAINSTSVGLSGNVTIQGEGEVNVEIIKDENFTGDDFNLYGASVSNANTMTIEPDIKISVVNSYCANSEPKGEAVGILNEGTFIANGDLTILSGDCALKTSEDSYTKIEGKLDLSQNAYEGTNTSYVHNQGTLEAGALKLTTDKDHKAITVNNSGQIKVGSLEIFDDTSKGTIISNTGEFIVNENVSLKSAGRANIKNQGNALEVAGNFDLFGSSVGVEGNYNVSKDIVINISNNDSASHNESWLDGNIKTANLTFISAEENASLLLVGEIKIDGLLNSKQAVEISGKVETDKINIEGSDLSVKNGELKTTNLILTNGRLEITGDVSSLVQATNTIAINTDIVSDSTNQAAKGTLVTDNLNLVESAINKVKVNVKGDTILFNSDANANEEHYVLSAGSSINESGSGKVQIDGNLKTENTSINLNGADSYIKGNIHLTNNSSLSLENNATLYTKRAEDSDYRSNQEISRLNANNARIVLYDYSNGKINNLHIGELSGTGSVFDLGVKLEDATQKNIASSLLTIGKNTTADATHKLKLHPVDVDNFIMRSGSTINSFVVAQDYSPQNGGKNLNFTVDKFDVGLYNYTPTLAKETINNCITWKVVDLSPTVTDKQAAVLDIADSINNKSLENAIADAIKKANASDDKVKENNSGIDKTDEVLESQEQVKDVPPDENESNKTTEATVKDAVVTKTVEPEASKSAEPVLSNLVHNIQGTTVNNYTRMRSEYNNLSQRLGELHENDAENGIWARDFNGRESSGTYGFTGNYNVFQVGYDRIVKQNAGGKWIVGAAFSKYDGKAYFDNQGQTKNDSSGIALYGTYIGKKGHYLDIVARHNRMSTEIESTALGGKVIEGDYANRSTSFGLEHGRRIQLQDNFFIQPEAEIVFGHASSADYILSDDTRVAQAGVSSWTGRLGFKLGKKSGANSFYAGLNLLHDFGADTEVTLTDKYGNTHTNKERVQDTWLELSLGGNAKLGHSTNAYADFSKTFGADVQTKWKYNVGLRCSF